tara:strand:+ start:169 stop:771 length:603 start_codon:yes stop_codon:yes gene_type:complete
MNKQRRTRIGANKQNYRLWYNYLQIALEKYPKLIDKKYYSKWHISLIKKGVRFDTWYKEHKHLFIENKKISILIPSTLSYNDAVKKVKELLKGKTDQTTEFNITSKRFRYLEIDDYLKCYKKRQQGKKLYDIGTLLEEEYLKKSEQYQKSKKLLQRKLLKKKVEDMKNNYDNIINIVLRKIKKCEKIIQNTAKGQFPGEY